MNSNFRISFPRTCALALFICLILPACGGLKTRDKDERATSQIKNAAVVAFMVDEPAAATLGLNVGSGKVKGMHGGSMISKNASEVDQMLAALQGTLKDQLHWKVQGTSEMVARPGYLAAYDRTMKGFQNKFPPSSGQNRFLVPKVMDFDSVRILGQEGRDQLITALGVDAIVAVRVDVILKGTTFAGIGARHPQSQFSFYVYSKGKEAPIWFEGRIAGEEAKESVGSTGFIDEQLLSELALRSAHTAFRQLASAAH